MSKVDLHVHSNASDGRYSPAEIVRKAAEYGLTFIAICDHDTMDGIPSALEAAKSFPQLKVIPGLELNADVPRGELHILGYFMDYNHAELKETLERLRNSRIIRAQKMIVRLHELGIYIDFQRVRELAGNGAIGRPHIAQAMLEKGYISSFREAFTRYISRGGPAYIERDKIAPIEAVKLIRLAGGLPVLGHPFTFDNVENMVRELAAAGLVGIETYYNNYSPDQVRELLNMADKYNLIPTGGSDYHGLDDTNETLMGSVEVPLESAERLLAIAGR